MNIAKYAVISSWVFQHCADWQEYHQGAQDHRLYQEIRGFFEHDSNRKVYIVEDPTTHMEEYNQGYLPDLELIAKEFGARIIKCDSREARRFYVARVKDQARKFEACINPFKTLTFRF